jgi:predicted regulator of Ras-like GTPase activity (Roadblock/LC7/MglB family)
MQASDDIRRWSNELATDPQSLVFADLAEALRQQGDLETAERLATRGLERHPQHTAALRVLARIAESRGDLTGAGALWDRARALSPAAATLPTGGAHAGHIGPAAATQPPSAWADTSAQVPAIAAAYVAPSSFSATIAAPTPRPELVRSLVADADGLLLASPQPSDDLSILEAMAASVAGVGDDAARAMKHLNLGSWHALVLETAGDSLALAPAPAGSLTVLSVAPHVPIGRVRALLRVATARAAADGF